MPVLIDVFEAAPRQKRCDAADGDHVVVEERPVAKSEAEVFAELAMDSALEQHCLDRSRGIEADVVAGDDRLPSRREVDVDSGGDELHSGIHEVRLPFVLAAAEIR